MGDAPRQAGGRRVFSAEFKWTQIQRILKGEITLIALSRELKIAPSVIRNWKRFRCSDCRQRVLEENRERHLVRCRKRKVRCAECGHEHLFRESNQHRSVCIAIVGRSCPDCRIKFYSEGRYVRHRWEQHHVAVDSLPSDSWTQSGEIRRPELVATGQAVQGGLPGSGR